jgi:hypothetical protein
MLVVLCAVLMAAATGGCARSGGHATGAAPAATRAATQAAPMASSPPNVGGALVGGPKVLINPKAPVCETLGRIYTREELGRVVAQPTAMLKGRSSSTVCDVTGGEWSSLFELSCGGFGKEQHEAFEAGSRAVPGTRHVRYNPGYGSFVWLEGSKCVLSAWPATSVQRAVAGKDAHLKDGQARVDAALEIGYDRAA